MGRQSSLTGKYKWSTTAGFSLYRQVIWAILGGMLPLILNDPSSLIFFFHLLSGQWIDSSIPFLPTSQHLHPWKQWFPALDPQIFLDYNAQKPLPVQLVAKAFGSCSPRTSRDPILGPLPWVMEGNTFRMLIIHKKEYFEDKNNIGMPASSLKCSGEGGKVQIFPSPIDLSSNSHISVGLSTGETIIFPHSYSPKRSVSSQPLKK